MIRLLCSGVVNASVVCSFIIISIRTDVVSQMPQPLGADGEGGQDVRSQGVHLHRRAPDQLRERRDALRGGGQEVEPFLGDLLLVPVGGRY